MVDPQTLPAGPELDALITEKCLGSGVYGWDRASFKAMIFDSNEATDAPLPVPPYSQSDDAALSLAQRLNISVFPRDGGGFIAGRIMDRKWVGQEIVEMRLDGQAIEPTVALAVCRSALKLEWPTVLLNCDVGVERSP